MRALKFAMLLFAAIPCSLESQVSKIPNTELPRIELDSNSAECNYCSRCNDLGADKEHVAKFEKPNTPNILLCVVIFSIVLLLFLDKILLASMWLKKKLAYFTTFFE